MISQSQVPLSIWGWIYSQVYIFRWNTCLKKLILGNTLCAIKIHITHVKDVLSTYLWIKVQHVPQKQFFLNKITLYMYKELVQGQQKGDWFSKQNNQITSTWARFRLAIVSSWPLFSWLLLIVDCYLQVIVRAGFT